MNLLTNKHTFERLKKLWKELNKKKVFLEREKIIDAIFSEKNPEICSLFAKCNAEERFYLKSLCVIGQQELIHTAILSNRVEVFLQSLRQVQKTYDKIGGIIGYHAKIYDILEEEKVKNSRKDVSYFSPNFLDIRQETPQVLSACRFCVQHLEEMAEIYVLGGAADRLQEKSSLPMPAAMLKFSRKTLLQRLIEDVAAKEHLYYQLIGKKIITPIAIMTSKENNNDQIIQNYLAENGWFGRGEENFFFLMQPSVPVISQEGKWLSASSGTLQLKPGGHGALWKLAKEKGAFRWFFQKGRKKALVRQINNPIAGIDYGLLAFIGLGLQRDSYMGFASCPRLIQSAEGMNVVIEKKIAHGYAYSLSNIEYCTLKRYGIEDRPIEKKDKYSQFSSNTNILFVDLRSIEKKVEKMPYPGLLLNFKPLIFQKSNDKLISQVAGRLETTMQNIADAFVETYPTQEEGRKKSMEKIFITYNLRHKTISAIKKNSTLKIDRDTPEKCWYDLLCNHYELLTKYCNFLVPPLPEFSQFIREIPPFYLSYLPSLGPLYSIISQKIQVGKLHKHSAMIFELQALFIRKLSLKGYLKITSKDISGKCYLKNVTIKNKGISYLDKTPLWKGDFVPIESCDIYLHENSGFFAEDITIKDNHKIIVPPHTFLRGYEKKGKLILEKVEDDWKYEYSFKSDNSIQVKAKANIHQP